MDTVSLRQHFRWMLTTHFPSRQTVTDILDTTSAHADLETRMTTTDKHVGARIRACRIEAGLSLQQLGAMVGVSAPQLHKYELGTNRVTVGRLHLLAIALRVDISWLLDSIEPPEGALTASRHERLSLEMARAFQAIANEQQQGALCQIARALASANLTGAVMANGLDQHGH